MGGAHTRSLNKPTSKLCPDVNEQLQRRQRSVPMTSGVPLSVLHEPNVLTRYGCETHTKKT
jgi:hypothetical protein